MGASVLERKKEYKRFLDQVEEDKIVCCFGRDYFRGARCGSAVGGFFAGICSWWMYRRLRYDQWVADREIGLAVGVRNPEFPRSVMRRGLLSQPLLAASCFCLQLTCFFKAVKCVLSHRRCHEFYLDDVGYDLLLQMAEETDTGLETSQQVKEEVVKGNGEVGTHQGNNIRNGVHHIEGPLGKGEGLQGVRSPSNRQWTVDQLIKRHEISSVNDMKEMIDSRTPTFIDGVAVGLLGSIFDCYLPQRPSSAYLNMHFGHGL